MASPKYDMDHPCGLPMPLVLRDAWEALAMLLRGSMPYLLAWLHAARIVRTAYRFRGFPPTYCVQESHATRWCPRWLWEDPRSSPRFCWSTKMRGSWGAGANTLSLEPLIRSRWTPWWCCAAF